MKILSLIVATLAVFSPAAPVEGSAATSAALSTLKNMDYRYFVAGGTCAAFSHGVTTPIDVVKTKIQSNPKVSFVCVCVLVLGWVALRRYRYIQYLYSSNSFCLPFQKRNTKGV